jgi:hypothetical protein
MLMDSVVRKREKREGEEGRIARWMVRWKWKCVDLCNDNPAGCTSKVPHLN